MPTHLPFNPYNIKQASLTGGIKCIMVQNKRKLKLYIVYTASRHGGSKHHAYFFIKDTFNKLGYKAKINTHTTSCINLFLDIYLYSEYRLIYC